MIPDVADEQPAVRRDCNAVRLAQLCADGGAAVAGKSRLAGAGNGGDEPRSRVDAPHDVVVALGNVEVPRGVELNLVRHVQRRPGRGSAISAERFLTVAGDRDRLARLEVESPNPLIVQVAKIQLAIWSDRHTVRIVDFTISESR